LDIVFIRGLEIRALIGVFEWERQVRQPLVLNLEMATDVRKAAATDSIDDALNYAAISERLRDFIEKSNVQLVETLAERIAELLMTEFQIRWLRLELNKPRPLSGGHVVGVVIERSTRSEQP
jgi:7,8-dihydroneopterin aldolase/epimerase/oxygenase